MTKYNRTTSTLKLLTGLVFVVVLSFIVLNFVGDKTALAAIPPNDPPVGSMPDPIRLYLANCGYTANASAEIGWFSLAGAPGAPPSTSVVSGTTSVALQYNVAGIVCRASALGGLLATNNGIVPPTDPSLGLIGRYAEYSYGSTDGALSEASIPFNYTPPSGSFTTTGDFLISAVEKRINIYGVGTRDRCVGSPGFPANDNDVNSCPSVNTPSFLLHVDVYPQPVGNIVTANCSGIAGYVSDANDPSAPLQVQLYVDATYPTKPGPDEVTTANLAPDGHHFTMNIPPAYLNGGPHTFYVFGIGVDPSGNPDGHNPQLNGSPITFACPAQITCGSVKTTPDAVDPGVEPGDSFTVQVGFTVNGVINNAANPLNVTITSPIPTTVFNGTVSYTPSPGTGAITSNQIPLSGAIIGKYSVSYTLNGKTCPPTTFTVAAKPYLRVSGNDVLAGANWQPSTCNTTPTTANGKAAIISLEKSNPGANPSSDAPYFTGSGSQLAVFALGQISGFFSASGHNPAAVGIPTVVPPNSGLTFGNYGPISNGTLGVTTPGTDPNKVPDDGGQSNVQPSIPDYYCTTLNYPGVSKVASSGIHTINATDIPVDTGQVYTSSAGNKVIINSSAATPLNGSRVLAVNGDVYINGDIVPQEGYGTNAASIPALYIIAKGNIYIAPGVTKLYGVYVAEPSGNIDYNSTTDANNITTSGAISDCATNAGGVFKSVSAPNLYSSCNTPLTIDGSFISNYDRFLRTSGTLKNSTEYELPESSNAAENFVPSIGIQLSTPPQFKIGSTTTSYDSITSLPPVL